MGIRKHFEQQKEQDQEDFKISDLSFEDQKKQDIGFDPEKEITDSDWNDILKRKETLRVNPPKGVQMTTNLLLLFPNRREDIKPDEEAWELIQGGLEDDDSTQIRRSSAYAAKIVFPERFERLNLEEILPKQKAKPQYDQRFLDTFCSELVEYKVLYPNEKIEVEKQVIEDIKEEIELLHKKDLWNFVRRAADFNMLFPDNKIRLTQKDWHQLRNLLEEQKTHWKLYAMLASFLKTLSAERIEFTDKGINFVMPKPNLKQTKKQRPKRKTF